MIERCEEAQFTARMRPSQLWVALALFLALGLLGSQLVLLSHGRDDDQTLSSLPRCTKSSARRGSCSRNSRESDGRAQSGRAARRAGTLCPRRAAGRRQLAARRPGKLRPRPAAGRRQLAAHPCDSVGARRRAVAARLARSAAAAQRAPLLVHQTQGGAAVRDLLGIPKKSDISIESPRAPSPWGPPTAQNLTGGHPPLEI